MAKIMLVDDAAFMRMMVKDALTKAGYTDLIEAQDGAEAVEKFNAENPDLVFMEIKAAHPNANIVMCSAMGQEAMVIEAIKSGAKDFIVKPFKPDRILATAEKILS